MTEDRTPIVREFEVRCSVKHAFETWTCRINLWWPLAGHSVARENAASVTIEPRLGGRIFETTHIGHQILWGTVNIWEPPNRFGYLWHIGELDGSQATQVMITFTALGSSRTRIAIEHKGWENAGPKGGWRRDRNEWAWDNLIPVFTDFVADKSDHSSGDVGRRSK
jgi:hypothetical protein